MAAEGGSDKPAAQAVRIYKMGKKRNDPEWKMAMRWFYRYLGKYKWKEGVGLVLVTFCSALTIVNPKITGFIVVPFSSFLRSGFLRHAPRICSMT